MRMGCGGIGKWVMTVSTKPFFAAFAVDCHASIKLCVGRVAVGTHQVEAFIPQLASDDLCLPFDTRRVKSLKLLGNFGFIGFCFGIGNSRGQLFPLAICESNLELGQSH